MPKRLRSLVKLTAIVLVLTCANSPVRGDQALEPLSYTLKFSTPDKHIAEVEVTVPTAKRDAVELMMPVWSGKEKGTG